MFVIHVHNCNRPRRAQAIAHSKLLRNLPIISTKFHPPLVHLRPADSPRVCLPWNQLHTLLLFKSYKFVNFMHECNMLGFAWASYDLLQVSKKLIHLVLWHWHAMSVHHLCPFATCRVDIYKCNRPKCMALGCDSLQVSYEILPSHLPSFILH